MPLLKEIELRYRMTEVESDVIGAKTSCSREVAELFRDLQNEAKEKFIVINLDTKHRIMCFEVVAIGTVDRITMRPMEVFRTSIVVNAASAIVVHNHPSGDPTPSQSDIDLTEKLLRIADDLGLTLLDHIIIGAEGYVSFADERILKR